LNIQTERKAIERKSLHDEIADLLREMIVECELAPGERINEKELTEHFGVSRTPLREALKVLSHEGLIKLNVNRGAIVSNFTLTDIEEVFPVLSGLEGVAGELACDKISDQEVANIRKVHLLMEKAYSARDRSSYFRLNQEIHERILKAADNETLSASHRNIFGRVKRARYIANISDDRWQSAMEEHRQILDALEARDGARLAGILRNHVVGKLVALTKAFNEAEFQSL